MPGNSRSDQSLVPSRIDGIAMKTEDTRNPDANAIVRFVFSVWAMQLGRAAS